MEKKNRIADGNPRTPNLGISLIPIVAIFVLLYGSLRIFNLDVQIPLIFCIYHRRFYRRGNPEEQVGYH